MSLDEHIARYEEGVFKLQYLKQRDGRTTGESHATHARSVTSRVERLAMFTMSEQVRNGRRGVLARNMTR